MTDPVDLTNLHEMTDNDKVLEEALFQEFFIAADETIKTLEANCVEDANEPWRSAAHALKGVAYNLGAIALGDLCKKAQDGYAAGIAEKRELLQAIQAAYTESKLFLENVHH